MTVFGTIADAASGVKENSAQFALVDPHGGVQTRGKVTLDRFGGPVFSTRYERRVWVLTGTAGRS